MSVYRVAAFALIVLVSAPPSRAQDSKENADFKLALNLFNDGMYDLAAEQLQQFIATYPTSAQGIDARFYLGLTQQKLRKYDDARLTFQSFALTYPDHPKAPEAWWNVGESYAAAGNEREAALAFERVKVFHPKSKLAPDALIRASAFFIRAGDADNARRDLRSVLQEYPTSSAATAARTRLARMYFADGNFDQAQAELRKVINADSPPDARAEALLTLGDISLAMGRIEEAESDYGQITTQLKGTAAVPGANLGEGRLLAATGRNAEAIERFKSVLAGKADSSVTRDALIGLGDAYAALNNARDAVASYRRFLDLSPRDERAPDQLWKIGRIAAGAEDERTSDEACNALLKSSAPPSLRRRALAQLAVNAERQRNYPQALQLGNEFADQFPEDPATPAFQLRTAGIMERDLRDPLRAAAQFELAATRFHDSPLADDALDDAARCCEEAKRFDDAVRLSRELIARYPASDFRGEAENRIRTIETYEARDKDAGLEKLALLVGDVLTAKDKAGLAFRLGEIYFYDLRNFTAAAAQFTGAIEGGLQDSLLPEALYVRARSYQLAGGKEPSLLPKAKDAYRIALQSYPDGTRSNEEELGLFTLTAGSADSARAYAMALLSRKPGFAYRDTMLLITGRLEETARDTTDALALYADLSQSASSPSVLEEAAFRRITLQLARKADDSTLAAGTAFAARYPGSRYSPVLLGRTGDSCIALGQAHRGAELYRQLIREYPYTGVAGQARRRLADALVADGSFAPAIDIYKTLVDEEENDPLSAGSASVDLLLALGRACQLDGKPDEARKYLFAVVAREQKGQEAAAAYTSLGVIERSAGSLETAASYFRQAESASPGAAASRDIADLFFESGNYADAIRLYTQLAHSTAAENDRRYADARIIVARLRTDGPAKTEPEIARFNKTYNNPPAENAEFALEEGNAYFEQNEYAKALKAFQLVASKYEDTPSAPVAKYWIARTLESTGKTDEAVQRLNDLIKEDPAAPVVPRAYIALGNISYDAEKWDEAVKDYRHIVDDPRADPDLLPLAMSNLIETYESAGIFDAALDLTRKYLEQFPNSEDSFDKKIKIGILYDRLGYYDQSVLQLQSLLDEAPGDVEGELRYYIAQANYDKGDYQQAILDFLKVPYLVTKKGKIDWTPNAFYMAGQSYEKMGRFDQALTMYRQIVERQGIDETFKSAAKKEIERVNLVLKKKTG